MDTEMKQKKYITRSINASLSEVFITDTQEPSKQEQIQDGCIYIFKKGKNIGQKCGSGKFKFCSKHKKNDLNIEVNQEKNVKERKKPYTKT